MTRSSVLSTPLATTENSVATKTYVVDTSVLLSDPWACLLYTSDAADE